MEKERLEMAFRMFDKVLFYFNWKDGSGTISTEEIKNIFGSNAQIADSVWSDLVKEVDQNSDG